MDLVRALTLKTMKYNFYFKAVHGPGHAMQWHCWFYFSFSANQISEASPACRPTAATSTAGTFSSPENDLRRYQIASLAQGTIKTYSSGEKQFINFYHQFHLHKHVPLLPTTENILIYFAVFLAKTVNPETIKVYLATVRHMHLVNGYDLPIAKFQRLHYILRGIKRIKGASTRTRLPITLDHLKLYTAYYTHEHHQRMTKSWFGRRLPQHFLVFYGLVKWLALVFLILQRTLAAQM